VPLDQKGRKRTAGSKEMRVNSARKIQGTIDLGWGAVLMCACLAVLTGSWHEVQRIHVWCRIAATGHHR
jgi:hypothetical protein